MVPFNAGYTCLRSFSTLSTWRYTLSTVISNCPYIIRWTGRQTSGFIKYWKLVSLIA